MPRVIEKTVFQFDELSDRAKEEARSWFRQDYPDHDWWDSTYDDARGVMKHLGFIVTNMYFSGFWNQGDGACFEGNWYAKDVNVIGLKEHAPQDEELHRIADELAIYKVESALADRFEDTPTMSIKHSGHYYHELCTDIQVDHVYDQDIEDALRELARDCMRWLYKRLEAEHEYLTSDEHVDEMICVNEYEFDEDGRQT